LHKETYSGAGVAVKKETVDTHHKVYMPMR
jgi:hypothetical protein